MGTTRLAISGLLTAVGGLFLTVLGTTVALGSPLHPHGEFASAVVVTTDQDRALVLEFTVEGQRYQIIGDPPALSRAEVGATIPVAYPAGDPGAARTVARPSTAIAVAGLVLALGIALVVAGVAYCRSARAAIDQG